MKIDAKGAKKGAKMEPKVAKVGSREPKGSQMAPKGSQREPKGCQKGAKGTPKGAKGSQNGAKERPKCIKKSSFGKGRENERQKVRGRDTFGCHLATILDQKSKKLHSKRHSKIDVEKQSKNDAKRLPK